MYFSIHSIKGDRAAQLAVVTAHAYGEMLLQSERHVPFEAAACVVSTSLKRDLPIVAAQLLNHTGPSFQKSLLIGYEQIVNAFGGSPETAMGFFRMAVADKPRIRFESVGGLSDDIHSAKNRGAAYAAAAISMRFRNPGDEDFNSAERKYIDFLKSVKVVVDEAIQRNIVSAEMGKSLVLEIEEASNTDPSPISKTRIGILQAQASKEVMQEARVELLQRYKSILNPPANSNNVSPSPDLH